MITFVATFAAANHAVARALFPLGVADGADAAFASDAAVFHARPVAVDGRSTSASALGARSGALRVGIEGGGPRVHLLAF